MKYTLDKSNSLLHTPAEKFEFNNIDDPHEINDAHEIAHSLVEFLIESGGVGIAANQLGWKDNACAIKTEPFIVMFNPKIVNQSAETIYMEEGCLSYPKLILKVKRPKKIKVRFSLPNGEVKTLEYEGLTSRIIQHEIDHLNGITFKDRATRYHLEQGLKKTRPKF